jgi:hypothetical protein
MAVRQRSKHELVAALQGRYWRADRAGKARLLDEFCAATAITASTPSVCCAMVHLRHVSVTVGVLVSTRLL